MRLRVRVYIVYVLFFVLSALICVACANVLVTCRFVLSFSALLSPCNDFCFPSLLSSCNDFRFCSLLSSCVYVTYIQFEFLNL